VTGNLDQLRERIRFLEREKERLRGEMWRHNRKPSRKAGYLLFSFGVLSLTSSIFYSSFILAFIGLGLTFWGALLLYIAPTKFVKGVLLDSTAISSLVSISRIIADLRYEGDGVYLPPRYLREVKGGTVFIPVRKEIVVPPVQVAEGRLFHPNGICLTPPGLSLANLYEDELGTDFARVDLRYLQNNLPKLFIEGLEIAEDLELTTESDIVHLKIAGSIYADLCRELRKTASNLCSQIGCPLCSSIALAVARSTGNPVTIEDSKVSPDGKIVEARLRLLGKVEPEAKKAVEPRPSPPLLSLGGLILSVLGSAVLILMGWVIWQDVTVWGKDISLILFGSRIGEAIGLGIDMKVIYYLLIGSLLLVSGLVTFLRRKGRS